MTDGLKKTGFTIIELLTVLAIIALLTGILVPSLNRVRRFAKETKQKAQFTAIDQAVLTFRNDHGYYPPSGQRDEDTNTQLYNGAMKLAEALVGWDLMGFHPESAWRSDGQVSGGGPMLYDASVGNLDARVGPYLEVSKANAFSLNQLGWGGVAAFDDRNFVLCDSFGKINVTIGTTTYKAGLPILYYRADRSKNTMSDPNIPNNIYNSFDNIPLIALKNAVFDVNRGKYAALDPLLLGGLMNALYNTNPPPPIYKTIDQKVLQVQNVAWPYRPDSYILISAGVDGEYGTQDDITNCGN